MNTDSELQARIGKAEIRQLIPHSGTMCLLDEVIEWDERAITCASRTHHDHANPLRRGEHLSAVHAFEYGAQAVAVHGGLRARSSGMIAPPGYLAALRDASFSDTKLDRLPSPLVVHAQSLFSDSANSVYEVRVSAGDRSFAQGRVTIVLRERRSSQKDAAAKHEGTSPPHPYPEFACRVLANHPCLPGHFPGEPIVPGVIILDEVAAALAKWKECRIAGINFVKFLRPLLPDQLFRVSFPVSPGANSLVFQCMAENRLIAEGCLEIT